MIPCLRGKVGLCFCVLLAEDYIADWSYVVVWGENILNWYLDLEYNQLPHNCLLVLNRSRSCSFLIGPPGEPDNPGQKRAMRLGGWEVNRSHKGLAWGFEGPKDTLWDCVIPNSWNWQAEWRRAIIFLRRKRDLIWNIASFFGVNTWPGWF